MTRITLLLLALTIADQSRNFRDNPKWMIFRKGCSIRPSWPCVGGAERRIGTAVLARYVAVKPLARRAQDSPPTRQAANRDALELCQTRSRAVPCDLANRQYRATPLPLSAQNAAANGRIKFWPLPAGCEPPEAVTQQLNDTVLHSVLERANPVSKGASF